MVKFEEVKHLAALYLASVLLLVGMVTNEWSVMKSDFLNVKITAGLYRYCAGDTCGESRGKFADEKASVIMVTIGCISCFCCTVFMTIHYALKGKNDIINKFPSVTFVVSLLGAVLIIIGCILYGFDIFRDEPNPGYSYFVTIVGALIYAAGGVLSSKK